MNRITLMDETLSSLIAAGEVVNSPYNVVKELVENAIDAQATAILVELEQAGMKRIRVKDNGRGMSKDDALLCFIRHATSKIKDEYDLYHIHSLGFRGEALPSIAAVAKIDLKTSLTDATGFHVVYHFSKITVQEVFKVVNGTDIEVTELFHNTPARLKYLKSLHQENFRILTYINKMALLYPNIDFRVVSDFKEVLNTTNLASLPLILQELYGDELYDALIKIDANDNHFKIEGYVTLPSIARNTRHHLHLAINGRSIEHYGFQKVVADAYAQRLMVNRFPMGAINIIVDPQLVDVNVHPNKLEVKISKQEALYELALTAINQAIESYYKMLNHPQQKQVEIVIEPKVDQLVDFNQEIIPTLDRVRELEVDYDFKVEQKPLIKQTQLQNVELLGQVFGTYLIFKYDDLLYILDQHAAQERIQYEIFKQEFLVQKTKMTTLLTPIVLTFTPQERAIIVENKHKLEGVKVYFDYIGEKSIEVSHIPNWMNDLNAQKYIQTVCEAIIMQQNISDVDLVNQALILLACKLSLKANQFLTSYEQAHLIQTLFLYDNYDHCPHGRPIFVRYTQNDLEKMFKRVL